MVPDPLIDLVRSAARQLIEWALEAELSLSLVQFSNDTTDEGHARLVRHGSLLDRTIMTGLGAIAVKVPRARDRRAQAEKVRHTSSILPQYPQPRQCVRRIHARGRTAESVEDLRRGIRHCS